MKVVIFLRFLRFMPFFFWFVLCFFTLINLIPAIFIQEPLTKSSGNKFDTIIVLGNSATIEGKPGALMKERVLKAVALFHQHSANKIIFTGGAVYNKYVEAEVMAELAKSLRVPEQAILKEIESKNTYQSAFNSVHLMEINNLKSALIVTSKYQLKLTSYIFSFYQIESSVVPAANPKELSNLQIFMLNQWENILLTHLLMVKNPKTFDLNPQQVQQIEEDKVNRLLEYRF